MFCDESEGYSGYKRLDRLFRPSLPPSRTTCSLPKTRSPSSVKSSTATPFLAVILSPLLAVIGSLSSLPLLAR